MSRPAASLIALIAVLLVVCLASLCIGTQWLSPVEAIQHVIAHDAQDFLVWRHRLPRTLIAVLAGGSFALAGALVQGVIRNPLASPEILGVTQGAGLALTIALIYFPALSLVWLPGVACLGGALGAGALALYSAGRSFSGVRFALSGVAISLTLGSVIEFLILSHPLNINTALLALTGSLWSRTWHHVGLAVPLLAGLPLALMLAKPLNLIGLGDEAASGLGGSPGPSTTRGAGTGRDPDESGRGDHRAGQLYRSGRTASCAPPDRWPSSVATASKRYCRGHSAGTGRYLGARTDPTS